MDVPPIPGCHGTLGTGLVDNRLPSIGPVWHNELCMEDSDNETDADWPFPVVTMYGKVFVKAEHIPYPNHWCKEDLQEYFGQFSSVHDAVIQKHRITKKQSRSFQALRAVAPRF